MKLLLSTNVVKLIRVSIRFLYRESQCLRTVAYGICEGVEGFLQHSSEFTRAFSLTGLFATSTFREELQGAFLELFNLFFRTVFGLLVGLFFY